MKMEDNKQDNYYYDFFFCYLQIYREEFCKRASDNKNPISHNLAE